MFTLPVDEGGDDVAQGGEGQVDLGGFLQPGAGGLRLGLPLAARKIHQVQFPFPNVLLTGRGCN